MLSFSPFLSCLSSSRDSCIALLISAGLGLALELLSLPLLASSKVTSAREVLGEGSDRGSSGKRHNEKA